MSGPSGRQVRRGRRRGTLTRAGVATCGLCGKDRAVLKMGARALSRWRSSSRHGLVHVHCFRELRGRRAPARDSRGRFTVFGSVDPNTRGTPERRSRPAEPIPYGRGRPLPPASSRPSTTTTGLEGKRVLHAGTAGRILEVHGRRALVQPDPITTRTRTVVRRGRWGSAEVVAGELTEWAPDIWIELRRLSPA